VSSELAANAEVPESHARVLEAAWNLVAEKRISDVTLAEVAKRAGVSRQAVYLFFGGRAGLLTALTLHVDRKSGIREKFAEAIEQGPARHAIAQVVRFWFDYLPLIDPIAFALTGASATDSDAREAWQTRMNGLRGLYRRLTRNLNREGQLAEGWTESDAADFIYAQCHYLTWRSLVIDCGWSNAKATDCVVQTILGNIAKG